jgi:hypothetical protein
MDISQNPQNQQKLIKHKNKTKKIFVCVVQFFHMSLQCKNTVVVEYFYVEGKAA